MNRKSRDAGRRWTPWVVGAALLALVAGSLPIRAADHRDGPIFGPPGLTLTRSIRDINDVYIFQSPATAANTVMIMSVSPFSTATTPAIFDQGLTYEFKIATNLASIADDITYSINFGFPDSTGAQDVTLTRTPGGIRAQGKTGQNLPVTGGGMFRAGEADDPFFFDAVGFNTLLNSPPGGTFPRPPGTAANFFGPNANTLAITLEVPTSTIGANGTEIGFWGRVLFSGVQLDRMGRPAINTALIPPIPRGPNNPIGQGGQNRQEKRNAFNAGHPSNDVANFTSDMVSVLTNFYGFSPGNAAAVAGLLLPDVNVFVLGDPNGFGVLTPGGRLGNGRKLRDDVIDVELSVLTDLDLPAGFGGGPGAPAITTDNVGDDNGTRITDGNAGSVVAFPYIGARNASPTPVGGAPPRVTAGDYDGDGRADLAVFRPSTSQTFIFGSTDGFPGPVTFGTPGDIPAPSDYDADGRTDLAVFRPSTSQTFIFGSLTGFPGALTFGAPGDIPVPGDYDGDRETDLAVFRPTTATWFIFNSTTGFPGPIPFGAPGDIPVPADYDGDRRTDLAVFRPTTVTWFIFNSTTGFPGPITFGAPGDLPVAGDYDGDGRTDLAVFRPSNANWFIFNSTTGFPGPIPFGAPGDVPVPGDYDADGRTDLAVFRPSNANWFIFNSTTGFPGPIPFGGPGDVPVIRSPALRILAPICDTSAFATCP